jgi:hypothetical protein
MVIPKDKFIIKNPQRNTPERVQHYVPQYQMMGIEPIEYSSPPLPKDVLISKGSPENPRLPHPPLVRQPYAESVSPPLGKDPIPNVGNNVEHTWSSMDGEIIDDITELDSRQPMIDNNEFVSGFIEHVQDSSETNDFDLLMEGMSSVKDHDCVVFVKGIWAFSGSQSEAEETVQDLILKDEIAVQDILVVRKVPVKVGVFLG